VGVLEPFLIGAIVDRCLSSGGASGWTSESSQVKSGVHTQGGVWVHLTLNLTINPSTHDFCPSPPETRWHTNRSVDGRRWWHGTYCLRGRRVFEELGMFLGLVGFGVKTYLPSILTFVHLSATIHHLLYLELRTSILFGSLCFVPSFPFPLPRAGSRICFHIHRSAEQLAASRLSVFPSYWSVCVSTNGTLRELSIPRLLSDVLCVRFWRQIWCWHLFCDDLVERSVFFFPTLIWELVRSGLVWAGISRQRRLRVLRVHLILSSLGPRPSSLTFHSSISLCLTRPLRLSQSDDRHNLPFLQTRPRCSSPASSFSYLPWVSSPSLSPRPSPVTGTKNTTTHPSWCPNPTTKSFVSAQQPFSTRALSRQISSVWIAPSTFPYLSRRLSPLQRC